MIGWAVLALLLVLACLGPWSPGEARCGEEMELVDFREGDVASPDLEHTLTARRRRGRWTILLDGEPLREEVDEVGPMGFLAEGTPHVAWRRGRSWWQQVGTRAFGPFDALGPLVAEGARHAFAARRGGRWHVVVDGRTGASWEEVGPVRLSGGHAAWSVRQDRRWLLLVDGHAVGAADEVQLLDLDGPEALWSARHGEAIALRVGRRVLPGSWRRAGPGRLRGEAWRMAVADDAGWWVLSHDAVEGPLAGEPLGFAADGRVLVRERAGPAVRVVVGRVPGPWVHAVEVLDANAPEPLLLVEEPEGHAVHVGAWSTAPRGRPLAVAASGDRALLALAHHDARGREVVVHGVGDPEPLYAEEAELFVSGPALWFGPDVLRFLHLREGRVFRREIPLHCLPQRSPRPPGPGPRSGPLSGRLG